MAQRLDKQRIEEAVRAAESGTAGEIVIVIAQQAASYRSVPLAYALAGASLVPPILIAATDWPAIRIFAAQVVAALAILIATMSPVLRPRLVPASLRRMRGREAAAREFRARGMTDTRGRTGLLLYIAEAEHYAEVVGDVTIADRVGEDEWRAVITTLVDEIARGRTSDGIVAAVGQMGAILRRHVPAGSGDADELPNRVVIV